MDKQVRRLKGRRDRDGDLNNPDGILLPPVCAKHLGKWLRGIDENDGKLCTPTGIERSGIMAEGMVKITLADGTVYNQKIECSESMDSDIIEVSVCLPKGDEPEKPVRKIDHQKFDSWGFKKKVVSSSVGYMWDITSPHTRTDIAMVFGDEADDIPKLMAAAPDAMRALLAYYNVYKDVRFLPPETSAIRDMAKQVIETAGFSCDIE